MTTLNQSQTLSQIRQLMAAGAYRQALPHIQGLVNSPGGKKNPQLLMCLAQCQLGMLEVGHAIETTKKAIKLDPKNPVHHAIKGQALLHCQRLHDSLDAYKAALKLNPLWPPAIRGITEVFFLMDRKQEAYEFLSPLLVADRMAPEVALAFTRICASVDKAPEGIALLERWVHDERCPSEQRREGLFQLGALYDKEGRYDEAFETYNRANALRPNKFNAEEHRRITDQVIAKATKEAISSLPDPDTRSNKPIFIVGMPRSGTSLIEQALSCHPRIYGGGELSSIDDIVKALSQPQMAQMSSAQVQSYIEQFATGYLGLLDRISGHSEFVTDKNPLNFKHLGTIAKVFPGARVIHCVRNPLDTCVSNYFHNFLGDTAFSDDLADLGSFYNDYRRLMDHWKSEAPIPILDVVYEDVVADFETSLRRVIEFLGLEWEPAILRFHESKRVMQTASADQVRQPIYQTATQRWRRYERHLGPLIEALGPELAPGAGPEQAAGES